MNLLNKILETKRQEMVAAVLRRPFDDIHAEALDVALDSTRQVRSFSAALQASRSGIISEFKRRSPSKGFIKEGADVAKIVEGYCHSGAAAISVLTDGDYFGGSLDDLREAAGVVARLAAHGEINGGSEGNAARGTGVPLLRKDFIIDPYQICEARLAGADVILLIAAALSIGQVSELASFAHSLGLEVLLEVHNNGELGHICGNVDVVGVNNRDLTTFVTDTAVSQRLAREIPAGFVKISESGISSPETVVRLREAGFRGFLMGENFMKEPDPAAALEEFIKGIDG